MHFSIIENVQQMFIRKDIYKLGVGEEEVERNRKMISFFALYLFFPQGAYL